MNRQNILILSAGRRVELLEGFRDAAGRMLTGAKVFAADARPGLSSACALADQAFALPLAHSQTYVDSLESLCANHEIGLVIPTIDPELSVLARNRMRLADQETHVVISDPPLIEACADKRNTVELFGNLGIPTPAIHEAASISYPCFSKPVEGSSSEGAMRVDGPEALSPEMLADPNRLFMELAPSNSIEVTTDLYFNRQSRLQALVPRERIETRGGEVSKGITRRDWLYDLLRERLSFLGGARGVLTIQVFASDDDKSITGIEINPRFGGGFPLALAAGADFPAMLIREYLESLPVPFFESWEPNVLMLRYDAKVIIRSGR